MIARSWDGLTRAELTDPYADYVRRTGFRDLTGTAGNRGVYLLRRREGEKTRFRVMSPWDSMEEIQGFAGEDPERARYYPEDERFLDALAPTVEHFEVVAASGGRPAGAEAETLSERSNRSPTARTGTVPPSTSCSRGFPPKPRRLAPSAAATRSGKWWSAHHRIDGIFRQRLEGTALEEPRSGGLPDAAAAHGLGVGRGQAGPFRGPREARGARGRDVRSGPRRPHSRSAVRRAFPGAGGDTPHGVPQRPDRPAEEGRGVKVAGPVRGAESAHRVRGRSAGGRRGRSPLRPDGMMISAWTVCEASSCSSRCLWCSSCHANATRSGRVACAGCRGHGHASPLCPPVCASAGRPGGVSGAGDRRVPVRAWRSGSLKARRPGGRAGSRTRPL